MKKIKNALISVSEKTDLKSILETMTKYKINIISSGGTYKRIKNLGFKCSELSSFTKFPEILGGRVKTLHPKIHAGILNLRDNKKHKKQMNRFSFENIDLVIVNFYPFENTLKQKFNHKKIIENIDIGGPSLVRAAAKNYKFVTVITSKEQYLYLKVELKKFKGSTSLNFREKMAQKAFLETGYYDSLISEYLSKFSNEEYPNKKIIAAKKNSTLRYGENPHQSGALYSIGNSHEKISLISGKKLSYNNYNDLFSAIALSKSLPKNRGTVIIKHSNPCGVSINKNKIISLKEALNCDPTSAFGGIISFNFRVNKKIAIELKNKFIEIVIGNGFDSEALKILRRKKNLRIIDSSKINLKSKETLVSNHNNLLIQTTDLKVFSKKDFVVVSKLKPSRKIMENLIFAFNVCRFAKSNAIVIAQNLKTIGIGSGQPSRLDSCKIAVDKMNNFFKNMEKKNICAASDAFFPFVDGVQELFFSGVSAIIQPSGSIKDKEIIKFANKCGLILVFSKTRHFKH